MRKCSLPSRLPPHYSIFLVRLRRIDEGNLSYESFNAEPIRDCNNNPINFIDPTGHDPVLEKHMNENYSGKSTVSIVVMQPKSGSRDCVNPITKSSGHTFVRIQYNTIDKDGNKEWHVAYRGFGPVDPNHYYTTDVLQNKSASGSVKDDSVHTWSIEKTYVVSNDSALSALNYADNYQEDYQGQTNNCTTFAVNVLNKAGIESPTTQHYWQAGYLVQVYAWAKGLDISNLYGYDPGDVGEDIRSTSTDGDVTTYQWAATEDNWF